MPLPPKKALAVIQMKSTPLTRIVERAAAVLHVRFSRGINAWFRRVQPARPLPAHPLATLAIIAPINLFALAQGT